MAKSKRLGVSVFIVILIILLAVSVVFTFSVSLMFGSGVKSGKLFGRYIYVMEDTGMQPEIEKGSAVIAYDDEISVLVEGNIILFKNGGREDVMRIKEVVHNTDNTVYKVASDESPEEITEVQKNRVIAKCTTKSPNIGKLITFLCSIPGLLIGMIVPCLIILGLVIGKVVSVKKHKEDDIAEEEYNDVDDNGEFEGFNGHQVRQLRSSSPLFDPEADIKTSDEFKSKKSSIARNFSQKSGTSSKRPLRDERNVSKESAVEKFKAAVDEKPNAPVSRKSTLVPEDVNPEMSQKLAAIKEALSHKTNGQEVNAEEKVQNYDAPEQPQTEQNTAVKPVRKSSVDTSNVNSIDDLIKVLEEEKKKL